MPRPARLRIGIDGLLTLFWFALAYLLTWHVPPRTTPRQRGCHRTFPTLSPDRRRAKPLWVSDALIALAARDPTISCRQLAAIFNRRYAGQGTTVGKSFVSILLKKQHACILLQRRVLRRRLYQPGRPNRVWGMDGTGKTDAHGEPHFLLGIIDHGTRCCLALQALPDKASITLLRTLLDTIERYGKPRAIRTDNEAVFNSRLFRFALAWLGIRKETTELHCPWQNGRIEHFFGTLKAKLNQWAVADRATLNTSLAVFRCWYNHLRPHQHLQGRTPAEAWNGTDLRPLPIRRLWFEAWDGLLQGEYLER